MRLGSDPKITDKSASYMNAQPLFPLGDISFLHAIPPIGNKFHAAKDTGPQGQRFDTGRGQLRIGHNDGEEQARWMAENIALISDKPNRTYSEQMEAKWGAYYDLVRFVAQETPRDAILLFDSQSHINLDLYFLYPRKVLYDSDLTARMQSVDYLVLTGDVPAPTLPGEKTMLDDKRGIIRLRR